MLLNKSLDIKPTAVKLAIMRYLSIILLALLATPVFADQNPAPTSVGLYNFSTYTVGTSTTIDILPRNTNRAYLFVQNEGAVSVVIKPGSAPSNSTDGVVLTAGAIWEPKVPLVDALYGQSASSTAKIVMIEAIK